MAVDGLISVPELASLPQGQPGPAQNLSPIAVDYLIVGAGPGGLQLSYFLEQAGRDYLLLEAGPEPAQFFTRLPRSRSMISFNRIHSFSSESEIRQRFDWNSLLTEKDDFLMADFSRRLYPKTDELYDYMRAFCERHVSKVQFGSRVVHVCKDAAGLFLVEDAAGRRYRARRLIFATGVSLSHRPSFPGVELTEDYIDADNDPEAYAGQRVLIVGNGQSAHEMADLMLETARYVQLAGRSPTVLSWVTHHGGHVRGGQSRVIDSFNLKLLNVIAGAEVRSVRKRDDGVLIADINNIRSKGEWEELLFDRVICCTGFRFDLSPFDESVRPEVVIDGRLPAMDSSWESSNVPGLFFAGTLTQARDYKKAASTFIHGFRYNARTLFRLFEERFEGISYPKELLTLDADALADDLAARYSINAGLFSQFGFLCDALLIEKGAVTRYRELPYDYALERFADADNLLLLTMEWGDTTSTALREIHHKGAKHNRFLHPVIRRYRKGKQKGVFRLLEDIFAVYGPGPDDDYFHSKLGMPIDEWHREEHVKPLAAFLRKTMRR